MASDERWKHDGVRVIPGTELDPNTPQTQGMDRKAAITFARVGRGSCGRERSTSIPTPRRGRITTGRWRASFTC